MPSPSSTSSVSGVRSGTAAPDAGAPDLAQAARDAVVSFLRDASAATAEREHGLAPAGAPDTASRTPGTPGNATGASESKAAGSLAAPDEIPWSAASSARPAVPESAAVRAAAVSVATLARIEAAAAKVEADIATALRAHAELQAGAGEAAEAAVRAAQEAWMAAHTAVEADLQARVSLRHVARYVTITIALLIVAIVILAVTATSVH
jgi:hypothetical protein